MGSQHGNPDLESAAEAEFPAVGMERQTSKAGTSDKPTIAHLMPWPTIGGVEVATLRLVRATSGSFRHVAFCIHGSQELIAACREAGAEVVPYAPPEPSLRHFSRFFAQSRAVADRLRRCRADLAHCSEAKAAYHNSLAAWLAHVPLITHVRSRYPNLLLRERLTMLPLKRYIFVSKDSWRQFALKVPGSKARVLYDAVSFQQPAPDVQGVREELGVPGGAPLVGMVARVNPQKDYFTLADAAAKVLKKRPDARFLVVGDNAEVELNRKHYAEVRARLDALGIRKSFIFTGFRTDVPRFVSAMDVFVLCTHREGLPLSILEGMGMGKAVIATAVDGIPEVITDGVTGLLHQHGDSQGLADAILGYIDDPERAAKAGLAARDHVRSEFNTEAFARNAIRIYRELLPAVAGDSEGRSERNGG